MRQLDEMEKKVAEIQWATIFNNSISDSDWLLKKSFSPGRWAAGYPMLYILYRIYSAVKPLSILEFGLGESSKIALQYQKKFPAAHLKIIEQDQLWADFFSAEIFDLESFIAILDVDKKAVFGEQVFYYSGLFEHLNGRLFDLIIVDGPWGSEHFSRYQVVEIVEKDMLEKDWIIVLDDYNRVGEVETARKLRSILHDKKIDFVEGVYAGEKCTLVLCSPKYKFITSL